MADAIDTMEGILEILADILKNELPMPCTFAVLSGNGSIVAGHCDSDDKGHVSISTVVEKPPPPGFTVPIQVMFVRSDGEAARFTVRGPGAAERAYAVRVRPKPERAASGSTR
jgi:hypothetical protein